jgi:hypothetical protein|tara:strand:- start:508 stop:684 length:177 start_codon:yes stop_codon:yes gene_type:complete
MAYTFMIITVWSGLLHEITVKDFSSLEECHSYGAVLVNSFLMSGHNVVEAECLEQSNT